MNNPVMTDIDLSVPPDTTTVPDSRTLLLQFVRLPYEQEMSFVCPRGMGDIILDRVRVRWSKLRRVAKLRGRSLRPAKMLRRGIEENPGDPNTEIVRIFKTANAVHRMLHDNLHLDELLSAEYKG